MRVKEGKIGIQEGCFLMAVTLCVNGIFTIDPVYGYGKGNSTYLSLPLSIMLSFVLFTAVSQIMKKTGCINFAELICTIMGRSAARAASIPIVLALLLCAISPLNRFVIVMHNLVYSDVSYTAILAFIFPSIMIVAWHGLESIGRVAKCFTALMLLILVIAIVTAASSFESYRIFPIIGDGIPHMLEFTVSEVASFFPPMIALLIISRGVHGVKHAQKIGLYATVISIVICAVTQITLSLVYTSEDLSRMFMPLYRINFLNVIESYMLRFDKLFMMAWLNGCIISCAYCIYSASLLFTEVYSMRDVNPALAAFSLTTLCIVLAGVERTSANNEQIQDILVRYGFLLIIIPIAIALICGVIKSFKRRAAI